MADSSRPLVYSRSIEHAHPLIQAAWPLIEEEYKTAFLDRFLRITCTYRSPAVQGALWLQGRASLKTVNEMRYRVQLAPILDAENHTVTWTKESKHNRFPAEALDFVVMNDPDGQAGPLKARVDWDVQLYQPMATIAQAHNLISGGMFRRPDWPHIEVRW